jgi:uncharacterized protein YbjQ (UPF0145 family)
VKKLANSNLRAAGLVLALLAISGAASARNDKLLLPLGPALQGPRQVAGQDLPLRFGKASASGAELMNEVESYARVDPWEQSSYAGSGGRTRRTEAEACNDALRKAVFELQQRAREAGAGAVVGIVSEYERVEMDSSEVYECHVGMTRATVNLRGQAARAPAPAGAVAAAGPAPVATPDRVRLIASGYANINDVDAVPYLSDKGREDYRAYLARPTPKAFALSPSGHWLSASTLVPGDASLPSDPTERAVAGCNRTSPTPCKLYAVNGSVVWTKETAPAK